MMNRGNPVGSISEKTQKNTTQSILLMKRGIIVLKKLFNFYKTLT